MSLLFCQNREPERVRESQRESEIARESQREPERAREVIQ